jgi:hypothetical protein
MNRNVCCLIVAVFLCAHSFINKAIGDTLYSQAGPSPPIGALTSDNKPGYQKIADNFILNTSAPATIRSLRFIGGYVNTSPPPITPPLNALPSDDFRVVFFSDLSGAPGLPLIGGDFSVGAPVRRTPTNGPLLNGDTTPLEYILDLGTGISVAPATVYWLSVVNNPGPNYGWSWARTSRVFDQKTAGTSGDVTAGPWSTFTNGGMYFELSDNNVPEPDSFLMILLTAGGMWWLWRCVS